MADPNDLTDLIVSEARLPKASASDGQSAEGRSISDIVTADKYAAAKAAAAKGSAWGRNKMAKAVPPDSTGRC